MAKKNEHKIETTEKRNCMLNTWHEIDKCRWQQPTTPLYLNICCDQSWKCFLFVYVDCVCMGVCVCVCIIINWERKNEITDEVKINKSKSYGCVNGQGPMIKMIMKINLPLLNVNTYTTENESGGGDVNHSIQLMWSQLWSQFVQSHYTF